MCNTYILYAFQRRNGCNIAKLIEAREIEGLLFYPVYCLFVFLMFENWYHLRLQLVKK